MSCVYASLPDELCMRESACAHERWSALRCPTRFCPPSAGPHVKWIVDSAEKLPLADGCMDSYTISFGIRNVTNRGAALREAWRVLKPGGRFMCLEFTPMETPVLKDVYEAYSMHVVPALGQIVANDADSYR
jgi:demethylmenaquinone methyltransferase / 2-methoxy-6-polyprenyl-1,4-benzoquinol methylase